MDYATVVEVFFNPSPEDTPTPFPLVGAGTARRLRDATEPLATHAIWARAVNDRYEALGLNFLTGYVWGRAAALGEPPAELVASTFAVFEPGFVGSTYAEGRAACSRAAVLQAREEGAIESLHQVLPPTDVPDADVAQAVSVLRRAIDAADPTGRPLFAGLSSLEWPADGLGQLWRACELLREFRGDSHVAACVAAGIGPVAMNVLTELYVGMPLGSYTATRGWDQESIDDAVAGLEDCQLVADGQLTESGRRFRVEIEARTDGLALPMVEALGDDADPVVAQLERWSSRCVDAGAFPPDVHKRAAG